MNLTDEFILDAFKQQGLLSEEVLNEIINEVGEQSEGGVGDKELAIMNGVLAKTGMPVQEVVNFVATEMNMDAVDLDHVNPGEEIINLLTAEWARE